MDRTRWLGWDDKGRVAVFHWRGRRWLLERPGVDAFGVFVLDTMMAMYLARAFDAALLFVRDPAAPNATLYDLESAAVRRVGERTPEAARLRALWAVTRAWSNAVAVVAVCVRLPYVWVRVAWLTFMRHAIPAAAKAGERLATKSGGVRASLAQYLLQIPKRTKPVPAGKYQKFFGPREPVIPTPGRIVAAGLARRDQFERRVQLWDFDQRLVFATDPIEPRLPAELEARGAALAEHLGVAPGAPLVCLHAREGGYGTTRGLEERFKDFVRNVDIATYEPAIDYLVREGYTVVRFGDPTMRRLDRRGVVDLAHVAGERGLLQVWFSLRAAFLITGDSGPFFLPWLLNRPYLGINMIGSPIVSYPLRSGDMYVLKRIRRRDTGHVLSLAEMFTEDYMNNRYEEDLFEQIENSPVDILDAVRDMVQARRSPAPPTGSQIEFRQVVESYLQASPNKKGWIDGSPLYLGDGYIAPSFASRYLWPEGRCAVGGAVR